MNTEKTIPILFLQAATDAAGRAGADVDLALKRAGIPRALLGDHRARLTAQQMADALRMLWLLSDDEMLGMGRARAPIGTFNLVAHALITSPDLRTVARRLMQFQGAVPGLPLIASHVDERTVRFDFASDELHDPDHVYVDFSLILFQRFTSWMIGRPLRPHLVEMPYPKPANADEYDVIYGGPVSFGAARASVGFDAALLDAPIVRTPAELTEYLRRAPVDMLHQRDYGSSVEVRVRTILEKGLLAKSWPDSREVARRFSVTPGHLRRMLRAEGTSIGAIKQELLRDAAIIALSRGDSIEDISQRLGFSEPSAFRRAFKRWNGTPPSAYLSS